MAAPETIHLQNLWTNPEAASAAHQVERMMETEGWQRFLEAVEARLRTEQKTIMRSTPRGQETYDRIIGKWAGLESIEGIAQGIVEHGKAAESELR